LIRVELEPERKEALKMLSLLAKRLLCQMILKAEQSDSGSLTGFRAHYSELRRSFHMPDYETLRKGQKMMRLACSMARGKRTPEDIGTFSVFSHHSALFDIARAHAVLERVGSSGFLSFADRVQKDGRIASGMIRSEQLFSDCCAKVRAIPGNHPKIGIIVKHLGETSGQSIIFVETKLQAEKLATALNEAGIQSRQLMGSRKRRDGLKRLFQENEIRVIVLPADECPALPKSDSVINYSEPPFSLRSQRKGYLKPGGRAYTLAGDEKSDIIHLYVPHS
jgi:ERCC4-related helicase